MDAASLSKGLREILPAGRVIDAPSELIAYSTDASFYSHLRPRQPDIVVVARSTEDVQKTVAFAYEHEVPVTPRGASSGQTGGSIPVRGGIVIALNAMNQMLELDGDNLQAMIEPGIIHARLNGLLAPHRLIFPPDPGSSRMCTVGGMASTNAHGMRAVKYGSTANWVLGLEVVLADGRVITTGSVNSRARQSSSGLELTKLFVGAEGILGVITRLRLKLMPIPQSRAIVTALFDDLERAGQAVVAVFQAGVTPAAAEILDRNAIKAVNLYRPAMGLPEAEAMLLFEVDGNPPGVEYDAQTISEVVRPLSVGVDWSNEPKRINALWEARSVVGAAASMLRPGAFRAYCGEDLCVPVSKVPATLKAIQAIGRKYDIMVATYGHIGGGGMHPGHLIDPFNPDEVRRVLQVANAIHELALEMGGTVTGEHGVGLVRAPYMAAEHGEALNVMRQIKLALDPKEIMNPGKIVSQTSADLLMPGDEPLVALQAMAGLAAGLPSAIDPGMSELAELGGVGPESEQPPDFTARHGRRMAGFLGIRIVEEHRDRVFAEIEVRDELMTANGTLAGGAIMAFADIIGARATILNLPPDTYTTTLESKTNFFAGCGGGVVRGEATPLHRGRRTMVWQTEIRDAAGRLLAQITQTQMVLPRSDHPAARRLAEASQPPS